ncbi:MAG: DEAD/DEAH box helicase [Acidimicrobiales bacterium]
MTITFDALGVAPDLCAALAAQGKTTAFAIQELTIADAIAGRDVCGKAKTGSGKTLAFGLPVLQVVKPAEPGRPRAIILVPTRELATQVRDELGPIGEVRDISVAAIYGGADIEKQIKKIKAGVEVIAATPGRMIDLIDRKELDLTDVGIVVLDEADRMADMGFMPQVEWILRHIPGEHQTLLFSATLDGVVQVLVDRYQRDPVHHEVQSEGVTVAQMTQRFLRVHQMDKPKVAAAIARSANRTLMFTRTKRGADKLVEQLEKEGVKAGAIHGDLRQTAREKSLADFTAGKLHVLVATDVAARGIHVDDVDIVIHYDPPEDHKAYLHRSGRTARAGESGLVVTLVLWDQELEVKRLQKRLGEDQPMPEVFSNNKILADLTNWEPVDKV